MAITLAEISSVLKTNGQLANPKHLEAVLNFATKSHDGQIRHTGENYIDHPLEVAYQIAKWGLGQDAVEAALLHDVIDMSQVPMETIKSQFGSEVAFLVDGVTKIGQVKLRNSTNQVFIENLRKMFVSMAKDIRVVLIRLADRLHNVRTLEAIPMIKQKRIALETLEVYAPLAERLGMGDLKGDLEDSAFPYVHPKEYKWVSTIAKPHFAKAEKITESLIKKIKILLKENVINAEVHGRHKRRYSLYKKLQRPDVDRDINKIHDLIAVRIITKSKLDCYTCLGLVHNNWKPVPYLGISDFIAQPKPNGYQSIHTKIFDHNGRIIEVQIRSKQMHIQAEYGAAAHFAYSEAKVSGVSSEKLDQGTAFQISEKMRWIKELASWQRQVATSEDFTKNLKLDALSSHIYVFSPKGDVYDLPANSTPVDYAFAVHGDLGFHLQSAMVNGRIVPLSHPLSSGDIVTIIKSKNKRPISQDWLKFVKTAKARTEIRKSRT